MKFEVTGTAAMSDWSGEFITVQLDGEGREGLTVRLSLDVASALLSELSREVDTARDLRADRIGPPRPVGPVPEWRKVQMRGSADELDQLRKRAATLQGDDQRAALADVERYRATLYESYGDDGFAEYDSEPVSGPTPERQTLPEHIRAELFGALVNGTATLSEITRADTGFKFTARVGDLVAYGAVIRRTTVAIVMVHRVDGDIAYEPWGGLIDAEATKAERIEIVRQYSDILCPRWAEFGTIGNGRAVHVRERGKSMTLCGRGVAAGWLGKSEWSIGRCTRCNAAMDKRTAEQ